MESVSIAVLGCGRIARSLHLPALARLAGVRVVALADGDGDALHEACARFPGARGHDDYLRAIESPGVTAVVVCLPPGLHAAAATASLRASKHVYVEKPLATDVEQGRGLVDARRTAGVVGAVGLNYRVDPAYAAMREVMRSDGGPGLVHARSVFTSAPTRLPAWKTSRSSGGGVLLDLGSHHFDLYEHALGRRVVEIDARVRSRESEEDTAIIRAVLDDGATIESHFAFGTVDEDRFELYCEGSKHVFDRYAKRSERSQSAVFRYGRRGALADAASLATRALARLMREPGEPSFAASLAAFVAAIGGGGAPVADFDDGLRSIVIVSAAERSAAELRSVVVEPRTA
jgi:predicted dehydrogenase